MQNIAELKNTVQNYAWGSLTAIPDLLGVSNPTNIPQAELWMGAHPKAPSEVQYDGQWLSLIDLIDKYPIDILGKAVAQKFSNTLPYLFKVLAAASPLSIQAHPNLSQARDGFLRENSLEIPLNAPQRNYRDDNHKPECICALTPFWALCGFRKISTIVAYFNAVCPKGLKDELAALKLNSSSKGLKHFFSILLTLDADRRQSIIDEAVSNVGKREREDATYEWIMKLSDAYPHDIGILSPLLLNLLCLEPGQAIFLGAGQLHAYLGGVGIELMANSDNVLRGGLTPKHVDVSELLKVLHFDEYEVNCIEPDKNNNCEWVYACPAKEFALSVITLPENKSYFRLYGKSVEILLCTAGTAELMDMDRRDILSLTKGMSIIIPAAVKRYKIEGQATFYKATVPV
ncbi:MAG: mannose-6-phosphate isomerase, class I [Desulfobacterales bacterium]|jgi:mannose-6-phosphate isomerase